MKNFLFYFFSFIFSNSSFESFNLLYFLDLNNIVAIAHNIYNFVYTVYCYRISGIRPAEYPANETGYPAGYRISKKAGYPVQP